MVKTAYVCAYVRGLLRTVVAIRTLESRRLAALVLQVFLQVVLPVENAAAARTRELGFVLRPHWRVLLVEETTVKGKIRVCKKKKEVQNTNGSSLIRNTRTINKALKNYIKNLY